jgi:cytochrome c-type biogenesis protein CcmH
MTLWVILTLMACAACVAMSIPLIRKYENTNVSQAEGAIYEAQLEQLDRDLQSGQIDATAAGSARIEIQRRMLAALKENTTARPLSPAWRGLALISSTGCIALLSVLLYARLGSPTLVPIVDQQATAVTAKPDAAPVKGQAIGQAMGQVDAMITKLEDRLKQNPADAEGWRMLGWSYFNTQKYQQSMEAYAKAVALDPTKLDYLSALAESQVQAAQGIVTPEALSNFKKVLSGIPKDPRSRFYEALQLEQAGDKAASLDKWLALLADAPDGEGWLVDVRAHIADLGKALGRDVSQQLKAPPQEMTAAAPQITQDDVTAIQSMPAADQQEMIRSMVDRLAAKLEASPRDAEGWVRLMRSRMVLQQNDEARAALSKALTIFADDASARAQLKASAAQLGISEN